MPHLDIVAYMPQYAWALIILSLLFSLIVLEILPRLQQQLALRAHAESKKEEAPAAASWESAAPVVIFKSMFSN
uniref:ATP synthase F0 subunit 8 n=1 Tax=Halichondria panicea TaxID=6063 RepID=A0A3G5AVZ7_HALPA|nr:ATP synthase F0 subunit 8 [Halichondria panicea]AYV91361.1 ATP synthase F0 subunit 8 [Halichondria panicea]